jgi:tight adherence protein C
VNKSERAGLLAQLPNYVDLLRIGVEAGWSFDQSAAYLIDHFPGPTSELLRRTYASINSGAQTRDSALRELSSTCGVDELSRLINTLLTSEQTGGNISQLLALQAEDLRREQRNARERRVKRTPMKMTFVTVIFIFPAILCTLLAPAVVTVLHNVLNVG